MAPSPVLYLDHWQSDSPREPPGRPGIVSLEDVYAFEPIPAELAPAEARRILGAQVNAWTEHLRLPGRVEHQVFPRAAALAEATWSPPAARNWNSFMARLGAQFARYRQLGIRFADSAFEPRFALAGAAGGGEMRVTVSQQSAFGTIRLTRDGSSPGAASTVRGAFRCSPGALLRAAAFDSRLALSAVTSLTVDPQALRRRTDEELAQCTGNLVLRLEDDAPAQDNRAVFNVDIVDPCWVWRDVDLTRGPPSRPPWDKCLSISRSAGMRMQSATATRGPRTGSSRSARAIAPANRQHASRSPPLPCRMASRRSDRFGLRRRPAAATCACVFRGRGSTRSGRSRGWRSRNDPMSDLVLLTPLPGWATPLEEVDDAVFAGRMLGDGVAIDPTDGTLRAPCDGQVTAVPDPRTRSVCARPQEPRSFCTLALTR